MGMIAPLEVILIIQHWEFIYRSSSCTRRATVLLLLTFSSVCVCVCVCVWLYIYSIFVIDLFFARATHVYLICLLCLFNLCIHMFVIYFIHF